MSTIIVFVYLGLQVKWNQFSSNNSHHTSCIDKGSHAGKRPDLMTSKPDCVSTLGYHWTYHTGRPLEPQVHWDATGTTMADASTQWCSSGDTVLICVIGTHWKNTGAKSTLECHSDSDSDSDRILFNINRNHVNYIRLQKSTWWWTKNRLKPGMINKHVGRPLLRSDLTAYIEATQRRARGQGC